MANLMNDLRKDAQQAEKGVKNAANSARDKLNELKGEAKGRMKQLREDYRR